jgi:AN1-type zinc finger protein 5/6
MTIDQNNITNSNNLNTGIDVENNDTNINDTNTNDTNINDTNTNDTNTKDVLVVKPKKKKKNRCSHCRKNVGLLGVKCKCNKLFCTSHLHPEAHMCEFDHRKLKIQELSKQLEKVLPNKIVAI